MDKISDIKRKETEEEIIERKRSEYKKDYIKFLRVGEEVIKLRNSNKFKYQSDEYWEDKIQEYMNKAQIALYNYDLLDPDILKLIAKINLKETIDKDWLLKLIKEYIKESPTIV